MVRWFVGLLVCFLVCLFSGLFVLLFGCFLFVPLFVCFVMSRVVPIPDIVVSTAMESAAACNDGIRHVTARVSRCEILSVYTCTSTKQNTPTAVHQRTRLTLVGPNPNGNPRYGRPVVK